LALWAVAFAGLAIATRACHPDALQRTTEPPGDERPAIVGFLTHGWAVDAGAAAATVVDLAARHVLTIHHLAADDFLVSVANDDALDLTPYESQVVALVAGLADSTGVVPRRALVTGSEAQSATWWKSFRSSVAGEARARGLSRRRWSGAALFVLGITAAAAVVPAMVALHHSDQARVRHEAAAGSQHSSSAGGEIFLGILAWSALMAAPARLRAERDTRAGRDCAAAWLGYRAHLADDPEFERLPPAAVALWDRHLAYAAAMGVATGVVRALPLGPRSARVAWSSYGGQWHRVRIRANLATNARGRSPAYAVFRGVVGVAGWGLATMLMVGLTKESIDALRRGGLGFWLDAAIVVPATVMSLVVIGMAVRSTIALALGVADIGRRRDIAGEVLRVRTVTMGREHTSPMREIVIDDGRQPVARPCYANPPRTAWVEEGRTVRAVVSPHLGHVFELEPLDAVRGAEPAT